MATLTQTDIAQLTGEMQQFYMPENEACGKATPQQLSLLLDTLTTYTQEVQKMAESEGLANDDNVAQWAQDMGNWQKRLENYKRVLKQLPSKDWTSQNGCMLAYRLVTAPLLSGIWYEKAPGIHLSTGSAARIASGLGHPGAGMEDVLTTVNGQDHPEGHSDSMIPDVILPFTLGNQVLVYKEHQAERSRLFWEDLKRNAMALADAITDLPSRAAKKLLWPLVGAAAVGLLIVGGVYYYRAQKKKAPAIKQGSSANPELPPAPAPVPAPPAVRQPTKRQLALARMQQFDY
jgi:hypothetical protein